MLCGLAWSALTHINCVPHAVRSIAAQQAAHQLTISLQRAVTTSSSLQQSRTGAASHDAAGNGGDYSVQVVLLKDVTRLGLRGEVKAANPGWVRLQLFPQGKVLYATPENVKKHALSEEQRSEMETPEARSRRQLVKTLRMLHRMHVNISRREARAEMLGTAGGTAAKAAEGGEDSLLMQGNVTVYDVMAGVKKAMGVQLHESHIYMDEPITKFGHYKLPLNLRHEEGIQVVLNVKVNRVTGSHGST
ncbi:hypothetical protein QJQ45_023996 [Haematococcus lacustris]|nr:hypothetical protein QJQ45_023996 [Haematococcus lacustris]